MKHLNEVFKKSNNVLSRKNSDETVAVLRLDEDEYFYTLDAIAARFWEHIDGKKNTESIIVKLSKEFECSPEFIQKESKKLIDSLKKSKLIVPAGNQ